MTTDRLSTPTADAGADPPAAADLATHAGDAPDATAESGTARAGGRLPRAAVLWSYVLTIGRFGTTAAVTVIMARFLSPHEYGVMALAMVWVTFGQTLAMHGPGQAVVQREDVDDSHFDAAFWSTLGTGAALAAVFAVGAPLWAALNDTPDLIPVSLVLAPVMVLNAMVVVPDAILRRQLRFRSLSVRWLVAGLVSGGVGVLGAVLGWGVWALVAQQVVMSVISAVGVWIAVRWRPGFRRIGPALRELRKYSLHSLSGFFASFVAVRTDAVLLGPIFGPVAIGLYRFVTRIAEMVNDIATGGLAQVAMPHLSREAASQAEFTRSAIRYFHIGTLVAFPLFGVMFATGPLFLRWIGPQWVAAGPAFRVICVAMAAVALGPIISAIYQAAGRPAMLAAISWGSAGFTVVSMLIAGRLFHDSGPGTQVLAIASTFAIVQWTGTLIALMLMSAQVVKGSLLGIVRTSLPAVGAAIGAAVAGLAVQPLLHELDSFLALAATGIVAGAVALAVLAAREREVSSRLGRLIRR
ncbi:lipopolysaccharide biosynthesis protein [Catellatospora chokoriensis]|uniref:Uncharacterized protein n=1 Tax=Catellatospora chokoriensis TaxID=310353 RepID=A0A8J3NP96_9ACTN|nr:lipopolysaccharide biosynthesis protein [Catellatospora chokoriensis]GIF87206.1 hypothetical protein Cch02nite_06500 [Catellatospora chokoriensis]